MKRQIMNKRCGNLSKQLVAIIFVSCLSFITNVFASSVPTFHLQHAVSKLYIAQGGIGETNEAARGAWVSPLVGAWGLDTHRYILYPAGGDYSYIMNVSNGLVLSESGNTNGIGHWGMIGSDTQRWKEKIPKGSDIFDNKRVFINKASGKGLLQIHGGTKSDWKEVTEWPYDENLPGFAWITENAAPADLIKIHFEKIKCIKPSTGQDGATKVLFFGIDAALQAGLAAATGGASAAGSAVLAGKAVTKAAVIKVMKKKARRELQDTLKGEAENRAKQAAWNQVKGYVPDKVNDLNNRANQEINRHTPNAVSTVVDTVETLESLTSIEGLFNTVYGESPDDVELRVNGISIWPAGGRNHVGMRSQQEFKMNLDYIFERSRGFFLQLVEYDSGSDDDWLGSLGLNVKQLNKKERFVDVLIQSKDEGSIYEVTFTIEPYLTVREEQLKVWQEMQQAKKVQQEEKNRLNQAKVDRDMAQAAITPFSATLKILGSENGLSRIPLNRYSENPEKLLISPAIYLNVTFANGSTSNAHYHIQAPDNVIFDDTSGDPDDLIKLVYMPGPDGTETPGQVTATGKGVGTAYLKVSFRNKPGLTASVSVEVVDTQPPPAQAANHNTNNAVYTPPPQATTNSTAQFLNYIAKGSRAEISLPYTADVFKMTHIYSMCSSGCEKHHSEMAGVLVVLVMPGHEHNHVFGDQVIGQVRTVFGGTYCQGDLKKGLGSMMFTISDKNGNHVANTVFKPADCGADTAHSEPAPNYAVEGVKASSSSANGKYLGLLQTLNCPSDKNQYGAYRDYGYWGGGAWCGQQGKAGYWVWVAPNWYVWGNQR